MKRVTSLGFASTVLLAGCATPCEDDGLGQKACPEDADGSGTGEESDATDNGTGNESGEGDGGSCDVLDLDLTPQTPTVVLFVDQSLSMDLDFDMGTRWEAVLDALLDPVDGVVTTLQSDVRFGLSLFTTETLDGGMCPFLTETAPALDNLMAIEDLLTASAPLGQTPTGESLGVVANSLAGDNTPGDKFIVLATDGEPDTCAQPDPNEGQPESVLAAQTAYDLGIRTFVISVGDDVSDQHLQDMANAGTGVQPGDPDATFYKTLDQAALLTAFNEVVQGTRDCRINIGDAIQPDKANLCTVTVNDTEVPFGDPDGWEVDTSTRIQLLGQACESIQEGDVSVAMQCDCAALE